ncbi:MAG: hypothetical protein ACUVUU_06935 [bacterium]
MLILSIITISVIFYGSANCDEQVHSQLGLPYSEPDEQVFPSTAAIITDITCHNRPDGFVFYFNILALENCWEPIYSVRLDCDASNHITSVSCPTGWASDDRDGDRLGECHLVFSTRDNPIHPGEVMGPFGIYSESNCLHLSWYPRDEDGLLLGKVRTEIFNCTISSEPSTWGKIKALYR